MFTKDGKSVMVEVATGIDAPIKLLMPLLLPYDRPR